MVLVEKIHTLSGALQDGTPEQGALNEQTLADPAASQTAKRIARDRMERSLRRVPPVLDFFAYVFNPATAFVGPAFEFSEFDRSQGRLSRQQNEPAAGPSVRARVRAAVRAMCLGLLFVGLKLGLQTVFAHEDIYRRLDPSHPHYYSTGGGAPRWRHVLFTHIALLVMRCQYYGVWKLAEGSAVFAGFGFREKEGDWAQAANVRPLDVETSTSTQQVLRHWNIMTQAWLERHIFLRVPRSGGLNKWATFLASAFWHGFYGGYYLAFTAVPLMQAGTQSLLAALEPIVAPPFIKVAGADPSHRSRSQRALVHAWRALQVAGTLLVLDYALVAFCLLDPRKGLAVWAHWGYAGHILALAGLGIGALAKALGWTRKPAAGPAIKDEKKEKSL
jgi:lysophospholipid acyltransferase